MKKHIIAAALLLPVLAGCSDEIKNIISSDPIVMDRTIELGRASDDLTISVPEGEAWEVAEVPEWIGLKSNSGAAGQNIEMYVEDNIFDEDRIDTLTVATASGAIYRYPMRQCGAFTDPDNAILGPADVNKNYGVGMGINVLATNANAKYDIHSAVVNKNKVNAYLESIGEAEAFWEDENYTSSTDSYTGTSTTAISNKLSVEAGIGVEISAFEGKIKGAFSTTESSNMKNFYAMRNINHLVKSRYMRAGAIRYLTESTDGDVLAAGLKYFVNQLKTSKNPKPILNSIITNYGTHMITYGGMGGSLQLAITKQSSETLSEQEIRASLEVTVKGTVGVSGSVTLNESEKKSIENTTISVVTYGGENPSPVAVGTDVQDVINNYLTVDSLEKWVSSLRNDVDDSKKTLALVDIKVVPIWDLIPDKEVSNMIHEYIVNTYQAELSKHEPLIYVVDGLDNTGCDQGFVNIPEINVRLEYFDGIVPEIDPVKTVRILYSGTPDKMNYDRGFCIGGHGVIPGKLRRDRYGKYTYEKFDGLNDSRITSVYVDMSGDVTIAPQSTMNYINRTFSPGGIKEFGEMESIGIIDKLVNYNPRKIKGDEDENRMLYEEAASFWSDSSDYPRSMNYNALSTEENAVSRTGFFPQAIKDYARANGLKVRLRGGVVSYYHLTGVEFCFYTRDGRYITSTKDKLPQSNELFDPLLFDKLLDFPPEADCVVVRFTCDRPDLIMAAMMQFETPWSPKHLLDITFDKPYLPNPLDRQ